MAKYDLSRSGIYCIKNLESGRCYVGSAVKFSDRWKSHRHLLRKQKHHSPTLQRSWDKHGEQSFEFSVVEYVDDVESLYVREKHWMDELSACDPDRGFNVSSYAGSRLGVPQPPSVAEKIRSVHLGKPKTAEQKAKMSAARRGRKMSEETKQKLREAAKRQFSDPERREKAAEYAVLAKHPWKDVGMPDEMKPLYKERAVARSLTDEGKAHQRLMTERAAKLNTKT